MDTNGTLDFISLLFSKQEQWPMSYAYNELGQSLPEYHPGDVDAEPNMSIVETPSVELSAEDTPKADDIAALIQNMLAGIPRNTTAVPPSISKELDNLLGKDESMKARAQVDMYKGAVYKTIAAAGDFFNRSVGILAGQKQNIKDTAAVMAQNYQSQMDALDNQVLYIKHQLADRFNQTVQTNIMNLAAKNIRVNAGNVLDLSKEKASEITEDMRTAESNAALRKIALDAGKKQVNESADYAIKQMWTGFIGSAVKLGIMGATGGGTNESWGDLYKGYAKGRDFTKAMKGGTLNSMYD